MAAPGCARAPAAPPKDVQVTAASDSVAGAAPRPKADTESSKSVFAKPLPSGPEESRAGAGSPGAGSTTPALTGATAAQTQSQVSGGTATGPKPQPAAAARSASPLKFSDLYSGGSARGLEFSEKLKSAAGGQVEMAGYMAPPLKPMPSFFVLTKQPMAVCPFCSTDADWPEDIVLVTTPAGKSVTPTEKPVRVRGRLEIGSKTDPETGFVSLVRIYATEVKVMD